MAMRTGITTECWSTMRRSRIPVVGTVRGPAVHGADLRRICRRGWPCLMAFLRSAGWTMIIRQTFLVFILTRRLGTELWLVRGGICGDRLGFGTIQLLIF